MVLSMGAGTSLLQSHDILKGSGVILAAKIFDL